MRRLFLAIVWATIVNGSSPAFADDVPKALDDYAHTAAHNLMSARLLKGTIRVGVLDLSPLDKVSGPIEKMYADLLLTALTENGARVIERHLLDQALQESALSIDAFFDKKNAPRLGKLVGVDAVLLGTVSFSESQGRFRLHLRLVETETGLVLAAERQSLPLSSELLGLMGLRAPGKLILNVPLGQQVRLGEHVFSEGESEITLQPGRYQLSLVSAKHVVNDTMEITIAENEVLQAAPEVLSSRDFSDIGIFDGAAVCLPILGASVRDDLLGRIALLGVIISAGLAYKTGQPSLWVAAGGFHLLGVGVEFKHVAEKVKDVDQVEWSVTSSGRASSNIMLAPMLGQRGAGLELRYAF